MLGVRRIKKKIPANHPRAVRQPRHQPGLKSISTTTKVRCFFHSSMLLCSDILQYRKGPNSYLIVPYHEEEVRLKERRRR